MEITNKGIWLPTSYVVVILIGFLATSCTEISRVVDKNGTYLFVQLDKDSANSKEAMDTSIRVLESRLNFLGISGEVSKNHPEATKPNQIVIDIYGQYDIEKAKDFLLRRSEFQLRAVKSEPSPNLASHASLEEADKNKTDSQEVVSFEEFGLNRFLVLENEPIVVGTDIRKASAVENEGAKDYSILFSLKPSGAEKFGVWTENNINQYMATVFNDDVLSVAYIKTKITDSGMISGHYSKDEAEELAMLMNSGYFPHTLELVDRKRYGD